MKLSPEQRAAVERSGQDVCVVAGPGSGKTRVLIERFAWLVEHRGISPGRILAVTFTEKAANEIKRRLAERFVDRAELRAEIERAYVSTIHGFCARVLRENAIAAGLDPEFGVMDEPRADAALRAAAVQTLDAMLEAHGPRFRDFLASLGVSTNPLAQDSDLPSALMEAYETTRITGSNAAPAGNGVPTPSAYDMLLAAARRATELPRSSLSADQRKAHLDAAAWARALLALPRAPALAHFRLLEDFEVHLGKLKSGSPAREALTRIKNELLGAARSQLVAEYHAPLRPLAFEALEAMQQRYAEAKRAASLLDYADLEEAAIGLFENRPEVQRRVSERFDQILIDEFQDTNPLQRRLLDLIRRPGRFFAVGDINQSIYGFRHADPEVFREYRDTVIEGGGAVDELRANHRSRAAILEAVNAIVAAGMPGVEQHRLRAEHAYAAKNEPAVEMIAATGADKESAEEIEARAVASRIRELAGALRVGDPGRERECRYADFAILFRSLNAVGPFERALRLFGVPHLVVGGRTFFESREVLDLLHLLAALVNPLDEIRLAGVLRSPLAGASDETLYRLRIAGPALIDGLAQLDTIGGIHADERERLARFARLFSELGSIRDDVSPDRLLAAAIDDSGYEDLLGPSGRANVEKLLALLREQYRRGTPLAGGLTAYLEWMRASQSEAEAPPEEAADAVRLMSVHKAKGLEFPVVFLPALHRGPKAGHPNLCFSPVHGLGVKWRDPVTGTGVADPAHARICAERNAREELEEDRLLYVAMTRSREHLVFSCASYPRASRQGRHAQVLAGIENDRGVRFTPVDSPAEALPASDVAAPIDEEVLSRPALEGQYDGSASVTSVALFHACPRRYWLARYLDWPGSDVAEPGGAQLTLAFEPPEPPAAEFGTETHALLAGFEVPGAHPEAVRLAERFRSSPLGQRLERAVRREHEHEFVFAHEDVVLRGQIDLWFEEGGEMVLVDFKTDRGEEASDSYALQLRLYAMALERMAGRLPDRALLYYLRTDHVVEVDVSRPRLTAAQRVIASLKAAQEKQEFPLREGAQCRRCEFHAGACPAEPFKRTLGA